MDLREVGYDDRDWINLAQDRDRWRAYAKFRRMVEENKELAARIDGDIQQAQEEVALLRGELADTSRRLDQHLIAANTHLNNASSSSASSTSANATAGVRKKQLHSVSARNLERASKMPANSTTPLNSGAPAAAATARSNTTTSSSSCSATEGVLEWGVSDSGSTGVKGSAAGNARDKSGVEDNVANAASAGNGEKNLSESEGNGPNGRKVSYSGGEGEQDEPVFRPPSPIAGTSSQPDEEKSASDQRAYEDVCMDASSVRRWAKHLEDGNTSIQDEPRSCRPRTASTERSKERVDEFWDAFWLNFLNLDRPNALERRSSCEKRPGKKIILQHDNAWSHTDRVTVKKIRTFGWETLPQSPYSPDLAPSDYHIFGSVKEQLRGQRYQHIPNLTGPVASMTSLCSEIRNKTAGRIDGCHGDCTSVVCATLAKFCEIFVLPSRSKER
ncbi:hypothetical protein ANN_07124 [Periplaneta americana]|uniref:Uncharacterized protein n=1 Tax=Periplaneta americana TaxID=6978 RepID=A0ABQ8TG16_PERAM|nr:hypothetical protein ANN_07124 [Periplaneta americana]